MDSDLIRLIDSRPIEKFITDGLNSGAFGHDAIEILTEIHYAPDAVVRCRDCKYWQDNYYYLTRAEAEAALNDAHKPGGDQT